MIKRKFTLIELIIVLAIIGMSCSLIGIKINKVIYSHNVKNDLKKIEYYFQFCKKIALFNQMDVYLVLEQKKDSTLLKIGTDENLGFFKNSKPLKYDFKNINFSFNNKKMKKIEVLFCATGSILPEGSFKFFDIKKEREIIINKV